MMVNPAELLERGAHNGLIVVAHPDDETIGAAGLMSRLHRCQLIHVTDGAPRDPRFWPQAPGAPRPESRTEYARIRRTELARALGLAGIEARCASGLGVVDLEAVLVLGAIAQRLAAAMAALRPDLVVTHAYAGGHPDHDAVAFAVWAAGRLLTRRGTEPPPIYEMALYHGAGDGFQVGRFLPRANAAPAPAQEPMQEPSQEIELSLTEDERRLKRSMFECFESQREVLDPFYEMIEVERFRPAPVYDFTRPPHAGALLYERNGLPVTGERFRSAAARAIRTLDLKNDQKSESRSEPGGGRASEPAGERAGEART